QLESKVCKERNLDPISVAAMSLDQLIRSTRNSSPTSELSLYAGRGLGLAAVLDMAERTHCRVRIESNPGKGTRFVFLLPETASLLQAS
ncbi:MAG: ATP-binding protein, partial [Oligoflexus sp.]